MDKDTFAKHFDMASARAVEFARHYIEEHLPATVLYRLHLNASYDRNPLREGEIVFHEDQRYVVCTRRRAEERPM